MHWHLRQLPLVSLGYFDAGEPDPAIMEEFFTSWLSHNSITLIHEQELLRTLWLRNSIKLTMPKERSTIDFSPSTPTINFRKLKKL